MRIFLKNIFGLCTSWVPVTVMARLTGQKIILPFYHAVSDDILPHLRYSYRIRTIRQFVHDIEFFLRSFSPVSFSDLTKILKGEEKVNKPVMALSFDDGLREVHDIIAPLLIKKGIPATIFINPAFVDNRGLFFRYKAGLIIDRLDRSRHPESIYEVINSRLGTDIRKRSQMTKFILNLRYEEQDILDSIAELVDLDFSTFLKIKKPYLTAEQIKQLHMQGFQIGSHSLDHPIYCGLSLDKQLKQTKESLEFVRNTFNLGYSFFSFPFTDEGVRKDFFDAVLNPDKPVADLVCGTAGLKKTGSLFHVQRIPLEDSRLSARFFIRGEYLYYMLKGIAGRNVRKSL